MFQSFTLDQARILIDSQQAYQAYEHARLSLMVYRGSMHWKMVGDKKYLYKTSNPKLPAKSLGPESDESIRIYKEFETGKASAKDRLALISSKLKYQARLCKAVKINRVPNVVCGILRQMHSLGVLGKNLSVIGTHALYAYEVAASGRFHTEITTTTDVDFMWDARAKLVFSGDDTLKKEGFLGILKKVDSSFEPLGKRGFRAINKHGFFVDLVKPAPALGNYESDQLGDCDEIWAAEIPSLKWLVSCPKFSQVIIGEDGFPALLTAPDPRAFALHKLWLSQQIDREPIKKQRDRLQAIEVAKLVIRHLPHLQFLEHELRAFPIDIIQAAAKPLDDELPNGFFGPV